MQVCYGLPRIDVKMGPQMILVNFPSRMMWISLRNSNFSRKGHTQLKQIGFLLELASGSVAPGLHTEGYPAVCYFLRPGKYSQAFKQLWIRGFTGLN